MIDVITVSVQHNSETVTAVYDGGHFVEIYRGDDLNAVDFIDVSGPLGGIEFTETAVLAELENWCDENN